MAIEAWWSGSVTTFLRTEPATLAGILALAAQRRFRLNEAAQLRAWTEQSVILGAALATIDAAPTWHLLFEVTLPRLGRRADAVLLLPDAIVVLEIKIGASTADRAAREQADDFALDLHDFHAGSRGRRIIPIVVPSLARTMSTANALSLPGVAPVMQATPSSLGPLLAELATPPPGAPSDPAAWQAAPYRPVPPIIEAACALYARHDVEDIVDARAGVTSLATTTAAILAALAHARDHGRHSIVFVTGVPGAGKTLCGLNACFGANDTLRATFLTGNPALVHVLREALARDAEHRGLDKRAARQRMEGVIQALPRFRDSYANSRETPPEQVVVIDEAQRSWSGAHAIRKTRDRAVQLSQSEPAHLLAAMARHPDWACIVCLIGNGQEIHAGEGGLAEWGRALAASPTPWLVVAAPDCLTAVEPRRRLPALPGLRTDPRLHLTVPTRQIGHPTASDWVDAVLDGDQATARVIADADPDGLPYRLTRTLPELRAGLRQAARGTRRAGLVASSGARRLRAEGLGAELPHMDAAAVAHWFLDRWPDDVRACEALEVVATEFSVQGLELDVVGLCWDGDLTRTPGQRDWRTRSFRGKAWQNTAQPEARANRVNTYRVLLTRARHLTIIWVPEGELADPTRNPATLTAVADFLQACGVPRLAPVTPLNRARAPAGLFQ